MQRKQKSTGFTPTPNRSKAPKALKLTESAPVMVWGFTLLEILIVVTIVAILAGAVIFTSVRGATRTRDTRRMQEVYQIAQSLHLYYSTYEQYPNINDFDDPNCDIHGVTWDAGREALGQDDFIKPILDVGFLGLMPKERADLKDAWGSDCIYRYSRVENPCDGQCVGTYAILYAACESNTCPVKERPDCCDGSSWGEGAGVVDPYDIAIFLEER